MEDMVIKGTGNSRFLKTVADALTRYPTWESAVTAMVAGTFPIDLNGVNPAGVETMGTKLNKGNLLSDETAAALGNPATPNEALRAVTPVGSIFWFGAANPPAGFLKCDGAAVSRTDYAKLFAAIGTTFGAGDGSTTFALPNMRAAFVRGTGSQDGYSSSGIGVKQPATYLERRYINSKNYAYGYGGFFDKDESSTTQFFPNIESFSNVIGERRYFRPYNIGLTPIIKY